MLEEITTLLQSFFIDYGAIGVFFASVLEEIIVPIPPMLIILGSSFFMLEGQSMNIDSILSLIFNIAIPTALGSTIGSLFIYGLCYYIGKPFINKWGKYLTIQWKDVEKTEQTFEKYSGEIIIYLSRALPLVPSVAVTAFCGIIRYNIKKYIILTFFGNLTKGLILGYVGWQFGNFYQEISQKISFFEKLFLIVAAIAIVGSIIYSKKISKN